MTLLSYAVLAQPDPLQAGSAAALTLVVSNDGRMPVTCTRVTVTLAVGTNAKDLVADASGIASEPAAGWNCTLTRNQLVLTPLTAAAAEIKGVGLAFVFSGLRLNAQPGTSPILIDEFASSPKQPQPADRSTSLDVTKFPAEFALSELTATPTEVSSAGSGGSVTLMWSGSPANYALWYDPDGQGQRSAGVGKTGPYAVTGLTNPAGVTFTLTATVTVPGQDAPLTVVRQVMVAVSLAPPVITAFTGTLRNAGTRRPVLTLSWAVTGVEYCFLEINGTQHALPAVSSTTITPTPMTPLAAAYTLRASNPSGTVSSTLQVQWAPGPPPIVWSYPDPNAPGGPRTVAFGNVQCVVMAPDGSNAYVSCVNGLFKINLVALRSVQMLQLESAEAALALSPDGGTLYVLGSSSPALGQVDTLTFSAAPSPTISAQGSLASVWNAMALTPDGSQIFLLNTSNLVVSVYALRSRQHDADTPIARDSMSTLAVTPDGRFLLGWVTGGTSIQVLDPGSPGSEGLPGSGTPASAGIEITVPGGVRAVAFSPDATTAYVLFAGEAGSSAITAFDMTSAPRGSPVATRNPATSLAVSRDGSCLLAGGIGTVDVFTTEPLALIASYGTPVAETGDGGGGVAITPDGVVIVAGAFPTPDAVSLLLPASISGGIPLPPR